MHIKMLNFMNKILISNKYLHVKYNITCNVKVLFLMIMKLNVVDHTEKNCSDLVKRILLRAKIKKFEFYEFVIFITAYLIHKDSVVKRRPMVSVFVVQQLR